MFKKSQILAFYPWVELTHKNGQIVDLCEALKYRDARLYHVSDKSPDGTQILNEPKWYLDFKHARGNTQSIELSQDQAEEISERCKAKIETFEDGIFWF